MIQERRQHARVGLDTRVWLGQDGIFTQSDERLSDLSVGSAFIEYRDQSYSVGNILNLRVQLGTEFITATVMVRNTRAGEGIGVEFLDLSPEGRDLIAAYVAAQLGAPDGGDR